MPITLERCTPELAERTLSLAGELVTDPERARHIAYDALRVLYPTLSTPKLGMMLHYRTPAAAGSNVASAKRMRWWNDSHVDHVVGTIIEPEYGERAL